LNSYLNSGLAGSFANLHAKNAFEIPMQVFLPSGCDRVRPTISGTDIDGIREVNGKIAIYEAKNETAKLTLHSSLFLFHCSNERVLISSFCHAGIFIPCQKR